MRLLPALLFSSALLIPGLAASQAKESPSAQSAATADAEKKICKRVGVTGSRLGTTRVCKTAAEWAKVSQDHRDTTNDIQRRNLQSCGSAGNGCGG